MKKKVAFLRLADRVPASLLPADNHHTKIMLRGELADYQVSANQPLHTGRVNTLWGEIGKLVAAGDYDRCTV